MQQEAFISEILIKIIKMQKNMFSIISFKTEKYDMIWDTNIW